MNTPKLTFILRHNMLHLFIKDILTEFDLHGYGFDARAVVSRGENGNHLFKKRDAIKDIRRAIKKELSLKERFFGFSSDILFISDHQLNNLEFKHYCDVLEQVADRKTVSVYFDDTLLRTAARYYHTHLLPTISDDKIIGKANCRASSYWYKEPDGSIEEEELGNV